jgi:glycosyltransferase involved in cell wall biosynthesis
VDPTRYAPDPNARARLLGAFALDADAIVVGVAAQLIPRKGHLFLFDALAALAHRHPALRVICVGRGPLARTLERRIAARGLEGCVRLAGFRADWPALLPGLDLLAHTPEREGLGLAVLEAMSAGVPVVATAVGGIPDAVTDGVEGRLVPASDPGALAAALEHLIVSAHARRRFGRAGRIRACAEFSIDAMVDRYCELYRDVCAES